MSTCSVKGCKPCKLNKKDCTNITNSSNVLKCIKGKIEEYFNENEDASIQDFFNEKSNEMNRCFGNARLCFRLMNDVMKNVASHLQYLPRTDIRLVTSFVKNLYISKRSCGNGLKMCVESLGH